jgi:hypothetical protein
MGQSGIASAQFFFNSMERLLRFALPRDDPKCPICNFLAAGKPFVGPGKKSSPGKTAFYYAVDVPPEHFSLFVL